MGGVAPINFLWSDGSSNQSRTALCTGSYGLVVTDANGCRVSQEFIRMVEPERSDWTMTGNANTNPGTQFIGTVDNKRLIFKTNNAERFSIDSTGKLKFGDLISTGDKMVVADSNGVLKINQMPWTTLGNDNINADYANWPLQFIGTVNDASFVLRTFNLERMRVNSSGSIGIAAGNSIPSPNGTNNPCKLGVNGSVVIGPVTYFSQQNTPVNGLIVEGNVGIGKAINPVSKLEIEENTIDDVSLSVYNSKTTSGGLHIANIWVKNYHGSYGFGIDNTDLGHIYFNVNLNPSLSILSFNSNGEMGIGTNPQSGYKLAIDGNVGAREIRITASGPWPDFVFRKNYKLITLEALNDYITAHEHLPNMPDIAEINEKGQPLGEIQRLQQQKIEELTIYSIQMNEKMQTIILKNAQLEKRLSELENN